ncbi:MAG: hypothetical protein Q8P36_00525 [bacterium]|nr:hypothetical protein [bacterium]
MAILKEHIPRYREILAMPGVISERMLIFGYQDLMGADLPEDFAFPDLKPILLNSGAGSVTTLDYFDKRADLNYDMNLPVPAHEHEKYRTLLDIGCLEHLFDTRQCIENCLRMVAVGGIYMLHTCVKGYFGHGLHVFNPEGLIGSLELNNFKILSVHYTTDAGKVIQSPEYGENVIIWVVAKKLNPLESFVIPQQSIWKDYTLEGRAKKKPKGIKGLIKRPLAALWRALLSLRNDVRQYLDD